ncbi:cysteine proteinase [Mytilinidion resinicola]|uniref:Cysteine proteinase n=1 Tax=Mytilinidion resinicola TaxID=574789 RepID=A0A6A6YWN2_9PEZI|nr:cysteine proteinase [Mytilinidion resinicola]KAF2812404.1 cysteine proteinase [Mytilinidion resinicola]
MPAQMPTFSRDQVEKYFARIRLPSKYQKFDVAQDSNADALAFLSVLQKYHLSEVPFENLSIHYSPHRHVSIHADELYKKIVESDGRGGYCMENNRIFGILLKSLGFKLYSAGARVNEGHGYTGWGHMINLVSIGEDKYMVDVGFGPNGALQPLKLDRSGLEYPHITPGSIRLSWRSIKENTDPDQRLWIYEHRINDNVDFGEVYCFSELEFLPCDYAVMNYHTSTGAESFFTHVIICAKHVLGGDDDEEIVGAVIIHKNGLKWRMLGKNEREQTFETEADRLKALEDVFRIKLSPAERDGIRARVTEIRSSMDF